MAQKALIPILRPTKAEIDLAAFAYNLKKIRKITGPKCCLMLSIKSDAYGHGIKKLASFAQKEKLVNGFAVALIEEGMKLRLSGIKLPVLVLGSIYPFSSFEYALKNNLSVTVAGLDAAKQVSRTAQKLNTIAKCHIKVDTGLGRIGPRKPKAMEVLKYLSRQPLVKIEGIYTHFSSADTDCRYTRLQLKHFKDIISCCLLKNISTGNKHCANSHSMLKYPITHFDMVRPGLAAYGLVKGFKPVLTLKSKIVFLKDAGKGASISYNRSYKCKSLTRVATIPIGYGDGYPRILSNKGYVLIGAKKCKIIGNVTMDMIMVDITRVKGVKIGQEVMLIGRQEKKEITAEQVAGIAATSAYEITAAILPRVPRVYINEI
jgi:alanine racemase